MCGSSSTSPTVRRTSSRSRSGAGSETDPVAAGERIDEAEQYGDQRRLARGAARSDDSEPAAAGERDVQWSEHLRPRPSPPPRLPTRWRGARRGEGPEASRATSRPGTADTKASILASALSARTIERTCVGDGDEDVHKSQGDQHEKAPPPGLATTRWSPDPTARRATTQGRGSGRREEPRSEPAPRRSRSRKRPLRPSAHRRNGPHRGTWAGRATPQSLRLPAAGGSPLSRPLRALGPPELFIPGCSELGGREADHAGGEQRCGEDDPR